jgi:hypothetical protein
MKDFLTMRPKPYPLTFRSRPGNGWYVLRRYAEHASWQAFDSPARSDLEFDRPLSFHPDAIRRLSVAGHDACAWDAMDTVSLRTPVSE